MATTQLESGSFMVDMDCDCKSASMNKPLCVDMWTPPIHPPPQKILYNFPAPRNWNWTYDIYGFSDTCVHSDFNQLSETDKQTVHRMLELCQLFKSADRYVVVAPMWTLSFPYKLKQFIDCVILHGQTICISEKGVTGLLHEKKRKAIYIQASAAIFPFTTMSLPLVGGRVNHGITYIYDVFRFLGIECLSPILAQGTEVDSVGDEVAIVKAAKEIKRACKQFE